MPGQSTFVIADYKPVENLILQLKAAGMTSQYFTRPNYNHHGGMHPIHLNLKNTLLSVKHTQVRDKKGTTSEQTLYFGSIALCRTQTKFHSGDQPRWEQDQSQSFTTTLLSSEPLPSDLIASGAKPASTIFFVGKKKPTSLQLKHLSYTGLSETDFFQNDNNWYLSIPQVSLFEVQEENEGERTTYLLFFRGWLIAYSRIYPGLFNEMQTHFEVHSFQLRHALESMEIFLKEAFELYFTDRLTFSGTIEAFVAAMARNEAYTSFHLSTLFDSHQYSYESFNAEKLQLLCKAIENNPYIENLEFHDLGSFSTPTICFTKEIFVQLLTTLHTLPNFKDLCLQGVTYDIPNEPEVLKEIAELMRGIRIVTTTCHSENKTFLKLLKNPYSIETCLAEARQHLLFQSKPTTSIPPEPNVSATVPVRITPVDVQVETTLAYKRG